MGIITSLTTFSDIYVQKTKKQFLLVVKTTNKFQRWISLVIKQVIRLSNEHEHFFLSSFDCFISYVLDIFYLTHLSIKIK